MDDWEKLKAAERLAPYQFKPGQSGNPSGRPPDILTRTMKALTRQQMRELADAIISGSFEELEMIAQTKSYHAFQVLIAQALIGAYNRKEFYTVNMILEFLIGKPKDVNLDEPEKPTIEAEKVRSFEEYCVIAGYPKPFPKQIEMMKFGIDGEDTRLLLGSRGYGKTDYITILGVGYRIYRDPKFTCLLITKSKSRNSALISEIAVSLEKNGVVLEKKNAGCARIQGLIGKDHSVSAITVKSVSLRGPHPDMVLMDDPVTPDDVSDATRKTVERCYNEVCKLTQNVLVVGQPVHQYDLFEKLRPMIRKLEVPFGSIAELDPDLEAMALAGVDQASISASYYLKVLGEGSNAFDGIKYIDKMPQGDSVAFIDPSNKGGDFTALSVVKGYMAAVAVKGRVWKRAWNHCLDEIVAELKASGVKRVCFETNNLGDQPIMMLRQLLSGSGIGVVGKDSLSNKHSTILAAGQYAHLIHLSKDSDKVYIDQVVKYEYNAKNDDAPDSLARCLEWLGLIKGKSK